MGFSVSYIRNCESYMGGTWLQAEWVDFWIARCQEFGALGFGMAPKGAAAAALESYRKRVSI